MFGKTFIRMLCAWITIIILTGCAAQPAAAPATEPVKVEPTALPAATEPPAVPTANAVPSMPPASATAVESSYVASKVEDLVGLWSSCCDQGNTFVYKYNLDGTIQVAQLHDLEKIKTSTSMNVFNKFWFAGDGFHIQDINDPSSTCGETEGIYKLTVIQADGQNTGLKIETINDPCKERRLAFAKETHWINP